MLKTGIKSPFYKLDIAINDVHNHKSAFLGKPSVFLVFDTIHQFH